MTVPPSRPRRYQNSSPNPARSLAFCAPGWRVTWPPRDPRIPAFSPAGPRTWTPSLARDSLVVRSLILVAGIDIVAAAHARRRDSPAHAEPADGAPDDGAVFADTAGCRPSVSSAPSLQSENMLGTRCTAWNNLAASAALCRAPVLHLSRRAALLPVRCLTLGGSVYVSTPRVNFGERRREISHSRDDRGSIAAPVVASAQPASPRLQRRSRGSFGVILEIDANHNWHRSNRTAVTTERIADGRQPNCDREQMAFADRTPCAPNCGPDCRTACR